MVHDVMAFSQSTQEMILVKQAIMAQLAKLPPAAQEYVLADLVTTYDRGDRGTSTTKTEPALANGGARSNPASQSTWRTKMKKRGRPRERGTGKTAAIEAALKAHPGISIAELTKLVYPGEEDANHRVRAILWSLKKQGRARNPETGKWEVTPKDA